MASVEAGYIVLLLHISVLNNCFILRSNQFLMFFLYNWLFIICSDIATRRMGVYGFCAILKIIQNNNSQRRTTAQSIGFSATQFPLSGYSLMSQISTYHLPEVQRHFHIFALEIIGILRKCFNQTIEVKEIMYEGLMRAITFNTRLTQHIIEFLDFHFRSYFDVTESNFEIFFELAIRERNGHIEVWDNLGQLTNLMGHCIVICNKNKLNYDTNILQMFLKSMMTHIHLVDLDKHGLVSEF